MQLKEFKEKFKEIKAKGFIRSTRRCPTGIGHTLETLLGIAENNIASPDLGKIELKAHRNTGNSLITLFTFNNKVWKMPILDAVKQYGSLDKDGRQGLYYTMSLKPNSAGLYLDVTESEIAVKHISGQVVAIWNLQRTVRKSVVMLNCHTFLVTSRLSISILNCSKKIFPGAVAGFKRFINLTKRIIRNL